MNLEDLSVYYFVKTQKGIHIAHSIASELPVTILSFERGYKSSIVLQRDPEYDLIVSLDVFNDRLNSERYEEGCDLMPDDDIMTETQRNAVVDFEIGMLRRFVIPYGPVEIEEDSDDIALIATYQDSKRTRKVIFDFWENLLYEYFPIDQTDYNEKNE